MIHAFSLSVIQVFGRKQIIVSYVQQSEKPLGFVAAYFQYY